LARMLMAEEEEYVLNFPTEADEEICLFCYDKMDPKSKETFITPCNHRCHKSCMEMWKKKGKRKCPMCQLPLEPKGMGFKFPCNQSLSDIDDGANFSSKYLMENGEEGLNFPNHDMEMLPHEGADIIVKIEEDEYMYVKREKTSEFIGVGWVKKASKWRVSRRSKAEKKIVYHGCYDHEEAAAHASDTLARKLMNKGEVGHKLNFPDDETNMLPNHNHLLNFPAHDQNQNQQLNLAPTHNVLNFPNGDTEHNEIKIDDPCFDESTGIWRASRVINGKHVYAFFANLEEANNESAWLTEDAKNATLEPDKLIHECEMKIEKNTPQELEIPQRKSSPENKKCKMCGEDNFTIVKGVTNVRENVTNVKDRTAILKIKNEGNDPNEA